MTNEIYGNKWRPSLEIIAGRIKTVLEDGGASLDTIQERTGYAQVRLCEARDYLIARSEIRESRGKYELI